ncbi:MAG: hypothetical protein JRF63_08725 [Deltaproteobacteria bacterium]|nr:hypothetical protein [Deltaproteobacteria bacterium]
MPAPEPVVSESLACPAPIVGENLRVTSAIGESNSPVIAWNGSVFPIAWWDMRGRFPSVHMARIDREGVHRAAAQQMPNEGTARVQTVAADGDEIHLTWLDEGRVLSARFGIEPKSPVVVAEGAVSPAAGPWGAVAWVFKGNLLFRSDGMLRGRNREGVRVEPEPAVLGRGGIEDLAVAWNGKHYAVAWSASVKGGRDIVMQRVTLDGKRLGMPVKVSGLTGTNRKPVITWAGTEYVVAWTNAAPKEQNPKDSYRIFLAVVPAKKNSPRLTRQLEFQGSADQVALAASGEEFAVAWLGSKEPMGTAIYFRRIDLEGQPIGDTIKVTDDKPLTCGRPSLAWAGDGYGVTWHDDREPAGSEVFFSFISCIDDAGEVEPSAPPVDGGVDASVEPAPDKDEPELKDVF